MYFDRKVGRVWKNSCKNEVETDHRIRKNPNLNEEINIVLILGFLREVNLIQHFLFFCIFLKMNKKIFGSNRIAICFYCFC